MSFSFANLGHAIASGLHDAKVGIEKAAAFIAKVDTPGNEALVENLTSIIPGIGPSAAVVERGVFAIAGQVGAVLAKGDAALTQNLLNAGVDKSVLDDFDSLIKSVPGMLSTAKSATAS